VNKPVPSRNHILKTLDQFGPLVTDLKERLDCKPTIWFDDIGVEVVFDDSKEEQRRHRAALRFIHTNGYDALKTLCSRKVDQKTLLLLLRVGLAECWSDPEYMESILTPLKAINMSQVKTSAGVVGHSSESLGRELSLAASGKNDTPLPEEILLHVRFFDDPLLTARHALRCYLDVDVQAEKFGLTTFGNQLEAAMYAEMGGIHELLNDACEGCPVYFGSADSPDDED